MRNKNNQFTFKLHKLCKIMQNYTRLLIRDVR